MFTRDKELPEHSLWT